MKYRTFKKRFSNRQAFTYSFFINMLVALTMIILKLIRAGNSIDVKTLVIYIVPFLFLLNTVFVSPFFGKIGRFRWRLNQLFEIYSKTITVSEKMIFPVVKIAVDEKSQSIIFRFLWAGKVSTNIQNELEHRLSEIIFPKNEYLLEEPQKTQAYTEFIYTKRPQRLMMIYEKTNN